MTGAIIGGTGVYDTGGRLRERSVDTPYGTVTVYDDGEVIFLPRHGKAHNRAPHRIPYRANLYALGELGVKKILATGAVGSVHADLPPGSLVMLTDFLDFTKARITTFFDGDEVAHVSMEEPYCASLRSVLTSHMERRGLTIDRSGVYVCTEGPRFETAAEIAFYRQIGGDVVGMTGVPEVVLAKELGMCYQSVGIVTNFCTGVTDRITHDEIMDSVAGKKQVLMEAFRETLLWPDHPACTCGDQLIKL